MDTEKLYVDFADRVEAAVAHAGGPSEVARKMDVALPTLTRWRSGRADPSRTNLVKLANATGVGLVWLATGKGSMLDEAADVTQEKKHTDYVISDTQAHYTTQSLRDTLGNPVDPTEFVFVPRYAAKASAGHGSDTQDCGKHLFSMAFRRYWIQHYLRAEPRNLAVISVNGDSMEGVLNDRDVILIDMADTAPTGGLYVVRVDGDLIVKRLQKLPGGRLLLLSANPAYKEVEIDPVQTADFAVIGRVVWFARQM